MYNINTLVTKIEKARASLVQLEAEYAATRLDTLQQVEVSKRGETLTLSYGLREVKAKKNSRGRYKVTEGKQILDSDYLWGLHELRFEIATGRI